MKGVYNLKDKIQNIKNKLIRIKNIIFEKQEEVKDIKNTSEYKTFMLLKYINDNLIESDYEKVYFNDGTYSRTLYKLPMEDYYIDDIHIETGYFSGVVNNSYKCSSIFIKIYFGDLQVVDIDEIRQRVSVDPTTFNIVYIQGDSEPVVHLECPNSDIDEEYFVQCLINIYNIVCSESKAKLLEDKKLQSKVKNILSMLSKEIDLV